MQWCRWYLFVTLSQLQWPVAHSKVNLTLDLAIVYVSQYWDDQINKFKECTKLLPQDFNFDQALTRVAVVGRDGAVDRWKVFTPGLTSNATVLEESVTKITKLPGYASGFLEALNIVNAEVFSGTAAAIGRTRFIVFITTGDEVVPSEAETLAKSLRNNGTGIHVITEDGNKDELTKLTGDPQKVDVQIDRFIYTMCRAFQTLPNVTIRHACKYEDACFFAAQNMACGKDHWTRGVPTDVLDCAANGYPPDQTPAGGQCQRENCSNTCKWLWPLEKELPSCTDKPCGSKLDIPRAGPMRWKQLEYCPRSIECPACPTAAHPTSAPVAVTTESGLPGWAIALVVVLCILLAIGGAAVVGVVVMKKKKDAGKSVGKEKSAGKGKSEGKEKSEGKQKSEGKSQMETKGSKKEAAAGSVRDKLKSVTSPSASVKGKGTSGSVRDKLKSVTSPSASMKGKGTK